VQQPHLRPQLVEDGLARRLLRQRPRLQNRHLAQRKRTIIWVTDTRILKIFSQKNFFD
jgi:hypothetical protein